MKMCSTVLELLHADRHGEANNTFSQLLVVNALKMAILKHCSV
jgi:hypothetical protein